MKSQPFCPFYGRNSDYCEVGSGYISPYHVEVMVRHCTSRYEACGKYQELATREERTNTTTAVTTSPAPLRGLRISHGQSPALQPDHGAVLHLDPETLAYIQHQLRTPLTGIVSFSEILLTYPIDDAAAQHHFLKIIHAEAKRLSRNVDSLLEELDKAAASVRGDELETAVPTDTVSQDVRKIALER